MAVFEIPTTGKPETFVIALNNVQYRFTLKWNSIAGLWFIDIADTDGNEILSGVPMLPAIDLLAQYAYLGLGGQLFAYNDADPAAPPTFDTLGTVGHLYWVTP